MLNDKDAMTTALAMLKQQAHNYHSLTDHTGDMSFLREISSLWQQKQEQRLRVFEAMNQRGWYNPQLISNQQLQQEQNKMTSQQQQLQQQFQGQGQTFSHGMQSSRQQWQPSISQQSNMPNTQQTNW